ncbi:MAG TPA: hypothetical protein VIN59_04850 [Alphaproteobacteria bacterium]
MTTDDALPASALAPIANQEGCEGPGNSANHPLAQAARSLQEINRPFSLPPENRAQFDALSQDLARTLEDGTDARTMLFTQARILDALFKRLAFRDIHSPYTGADGIPYLKSHELSLALRSQKQCRTTIEALATFTPKDDDA